MLHGDNGATLKATTVLAADRAWLHQGWPVQAGLFPDLRFSLLSTTRSNM
jgi:hypothetical protein